MVNAWQLGSTGYSPGHFHYQAQALPSSGIENDLGCIPYVNHHIESTAHYGLCALYDVSRLFTCSMHIDY